MQLPSSSIGISDILSYLECPSRMEFGMQRHGGKTPPESWTPQTAYGTAIHHGIHIVDKTGDIDVAVTEAFREFKQWLDPDDLQLLRDDLEVYLEREPLGYRMVMSETEIRIPLFVHPVVGQIYFRARIDKLYVREDDDSSFLHRDYKSSKWAKTEQEVHEDKQIWAYNFILYEYLPEIESLEQEYEQLRHGIIPTRKNDEQRGRMKRWLIEAASALIDDDKMEATFNPWCPWCLPGDEPVVTSEGIRPIRDVQERDMVLSHKGRFMPVIATASREAKQIRKLNLSGGGTVRATPEHPILATKLGQLTIVDRNRLGSSNRPGIDEMPPGYVRLRGTGRGVWFDWEKAAQARAWINTANLSEGDIVWGRVPSERPSILTEEEKEILGWYLAEGDAGARSTSFALHAKEVAYQEHIKTLLRSVFDAKHFEERIEGNRYQLYLHDHHAAAWFRYFGGKHSNGKRVHPLAFSPESLLPLAITAWRGDGTEPHPERTQLSYVTSSLTWAYQLQTILLKNGIITRYAVREAHQFTRAAQDLGFRQTAHSLIVSGESAQKIAALVGGRIKQGAYTAAPQFVYSNGWTAQAIVGVEEQPGERVYDLQVLSDESFGTVGHVAVHNCPIRMNCTEITSGLTDFALDRIAVLAPREPKLKQDGTPGKLLEPPFLDPERFSEYTEVLPKVDKARRTLEVYSDAVKAALKQMPTERRTEHGYRIRDKKNRGLSSTGMRKVHAEIGDDFYSIAELSRAAAERFYGKNADELTIIDSYLEERAPIAELIAIS